MPSRGFKNIRPFTHGRTRAQCFLNEKLRAHIHTHDKAPNPLLAKKGGVPSAVRFANTEAARGPVRRQHVNAVIPSPSRTGLANIRVMATSVRQAVFSPTPRDACLSLCLRLLSELFCRVEGYHGTLIRKPF